MATTLTASLAMANFNPPSVHTGNVLAGSFDGAGLSASGSGLLLLAKIPVQAKDVQLISRHTSGATTQTLNFGIRSGDSGGTLSVSVLGSRVLNSVHISGPYSPTWDSAANERFHYVTASLDAGTVTVSMTIAYQISYKF